MDREPGRDLAEVIGGNGHLHTSTRVRADRSQMEMPDLQTEAAFGLSSQRTGAIDLSGTIINMCVKIKDWSNLSHGGSFSQCTLGWRVDLQGSLPGLTFRIIHD